MSAVGGGGAAANCSTSSNTTCEVEDLACGVLYNFSVIAKNSNCESQPSETITLETGMRLLTFVSKDLTKTNRRGVYQICLTPSTLLPLWGHRGLSVSQFHHPRHVESDGGRRGEHLVLSHGRSQRSHLPLLQYNQHQLLPLWSAV